MSQFEEMKQMFRKIGLEIRTTEKDTYKTIDVFDSEGNKAEFSFNENGNFSKTGYYEEEELQLEMEKYGYTKENIFDRNLRVKKTAVKIFNQTLMDPKYSFPEADTQENIAVYVTKEFADALPEQFYIKNSYNDVRQVYTNEEDVWDDEKKPLFSSVGPGYIDIRVPHMIYESDYKTFSIER